MQEPREMTVEELQQVVPYSVLPRLHILENKVRQLEKLQDTMDAPLWKKFIFLVDGWPLFRVVEKPQWRPWRKWWTS